ncbi:glutathione S-transferase-like [Ischnura elegans]|uniref:glutathione S-transferase-like n=1 Tax=Ischnura elegans TaxID=197161 RepID=UPI001ED869B4|nr:glutathione S-transferase-like [Ischnura elegans]
MAPKYTLKYFNLRGLGEPLRFLFAYGGIEYEDVRFSFEEWPALKGSMPYGKAPVIETDGEVLHQTMAMGRYLARQLKLTGGDDWEAMLCDMAIDTVTDFRLQIVGYHYEKDESLKAQKKEVLFNETIPYYLEKFDADVKKNDGHFVRGKLTWADLVIVAIFEMLQDMLQVNFTEKYSNLKGIMDKVLALPQIKEWVEKRPKTNY